MNRGYQARDSILNGLLEGIPDEYRSQIALVDGNLHVSTTMRNGNNIVLLSDLAAKIAKSGLGGQLFFHEPAEFDRLYHARSVLSQSDVSDDSKVKALAKQYIQTAYDKRASDIHIIELGNYAAVKMRVRGHLCNYTELDALTGERLISVIFNSLCLSHDKAQFSKNTRCDGRIVERQYLPPAVHSVRLHAEPIQLPSSDGRNAGMGTFLAMRLLYDSTEAHGTLEERLASLGYRPSNLLTMRHLTQRGGMTIISGPTGSGKSTVLKHILESMVSEYPDKSYLSVEDPPEYPIRGVAQAQVITNNKDQSNDMRALAYTEAINGGAMRSDPDVIMIGEIRYPEAAVGAIDAAQTGHSVWATIHANDAFGIVTRLESLLRAAKVHNPIEVISEPNVLTGLCYQRLIATLCPSCKKRWVNLPRSDQDKKLPMDLYGRLSTLKEFRTEDDFGSLCVCGDGCPDCDHTGLSRMTVVAETVALTPDIHLALRNNKKLEARQIWLEQGGTTYLDHAIALIKRGDIDPVIAESRLGAFLQNSRM